MNQQNQRGPKRKGKRSLLSIIAALVIAGLAYFFNIDVFEKEQVTDQKPDIGQLEEEQITEEQQIDREPDVSNQIPVELVRVTDGDTIKVIYNGEERNIRYLLIDTPEIDHKNPAGTEKFAREAAERNEALLTSGKVTIEFDEGDSEDKYGRLLAYIYVDGKSVQKTLLEEGLARVAYVFEPNTKYIDMFNEAANEAKTAKKGIWEVDGYVTNRGFNMDVYSSK